MKTIDLFGNEVELKPDPALEEVVDLLICPSCKIVIDEVGIEHEVSGTRIHYYKQDKNGNFIFDSEGDVDLEDDGLISIFCEGCMKTLPDEITGRILNRMPPYV